MQKIFHEYTQYFSSYDRKHMPPFVILKHIKWSKKPLTKSSYTSRAWVISIDYLQMTYLGYSLMITYILGIQLMADPIQAVTSSVIHV